MSYARSSVAALGFALVLAASSAHADEPTHVSLTDSPGCDGARWLGAELRERLRVEFAGRHLILDDANCGLPLRVEADRCAGATSVTLSFVDRDGKRTVRKIELTGVAEDARARLIALGATELLHDVLAAPAPPSELRIVIESAPPPPAPAPPPIVLAKPKDPDPRPPVVDEPQRTFSLGVAFETRAYPAGNAATFGARASASVPLGRFLALGADLGLAGGSARDPLGDIGSLVTGAGVGLSLAGGPSALRVFAGPRLELDYVRFHGTPYGPRVVGSSVDGALVALTLGASLHVAVARELVVLVGVDAGYAVHPFEARADDRVSTSLDGPVLGVRIGLGWARGAR